MADSSKDNPTPPSQSEEVRDVNLARAPSGTGTATGVEKIEQSEEREEPEDRGSTVPIAGGEPESDYAEGDHSEPRGLQAEPAAFATNGSVSSTRVATPSGPQPVAAFASSPEQAQKLLEQHREREEQSIRNRARGTQEITEAKLDSMNSQEIRAVAHDRGYDLPDHASKGLAKRLFLEKQAEDPTIEGREETESSEDEE